jgi:hypothetical protein
MQLECALFFTVVVGMACAIIAALSSLFWHSPDLKPHEKLLLKLEAPQEGEDSFAMMRA